MKSRVEITYLVCETIDLWVANYNMYDLQEYWSSQHLCQESLVASWVVCRMLAEAILLSEGRTHFNFTVTDLSLRSPPILT